MKQFHFYDASTGLLHSSSIVINAASDNEASARKNCPAGHNIIEGVFDPLSQRIDVATGEVIDYQPPQPSPDIAARLAARAAALATIDQLEGKGIRSMRELALGAPGAQERLAAIDAQIAALRASL
jgi:hypothetical protein